MAEIRVENLHKRFGDFVAVQQTTLTVEDGDFFVMLGPSGCGKTTTLRIIAGLEMPTSGRVLVGGEDVTAKRAAQRDIAFVFQLFALYPHMNVRKNLTFPLKCEGLRRSQIRARIEEVARFLRIDHLLDHPVSGLSGGDRQRVALGRAIVRRPKAFLMDEPLGTLDAEFRELMCQELRALHDRISATTIYVTHDQLEAMSMADRIAVMDQGRVEQLGTPGEIYSRPRTTFVADFIGSPPMNLIRFEGKVAKGGTSVMLKGARIPVPDLYEGLDHESAVLGVRPEHIRFADKGAIRGSVVGAEYMGTTQIVTVDTEHGRFKARLPSTLRVRPDETVGLSFAKEHLVVFDGRNGRSLHSALFEEARHG